MAEAFKVQGTIELDDLASAIYERFQRTVQGRSKEVSDALHRVERSSERVDREFRDMNRSGQQVAATFKGALGALGVAKAFDILTNSIQDFVRGSVDAVLSGERIDRALKFATGSAEDGQKAFGFVRQESARLGLELETSAQAFGALSAAAKGTSIAGKTAEEIFTGIGEAATVMGLSADQTGGALTAIQQIISKGTVQSEELRGQLGERLPGAFQIAARSMGVTTQELGKMLELGQVTAEEFLPLFAKELRKTFSQDAVEASKQGQAGINRFKTALFELKQSFGTGFLDNLVGAMNKVRETFEDEGFRQRIKDLGESFGNALTAIVENFDKIILAGKVFFAVFAVQKIMGIVTAVKALRLALLGLVATNPLLLALTVTAGAAVIAYDQIANAQGRIADQTERASALLKKQKDEALLTGVRANVAGLGGGLAGPPKQNPFAAAFGAIAAPGEEPAKPKPPPPLSKEAVELAKKQAQLLKDTQFDLLRVSLEATKDAQAREIALLQLGFQERFELAKGNAEATRALEVLQAAQTLQVIDKFRQQRLEKAQAVQEELRNLQLQGDENEMARLQAWYEERKALLVAAGEETVILEAVFAERKEAIHEQHVARMRELDQRLLDSRVDVMRGILQVGENLFGRNKALLLAMRGLAAFEVVMNSLRAATAALLPPPVGLGPVAGVPLATTIKAAGIANAAAIMTQRFADGGVVGGNSYSGDRVPARVNSGEVILNGKQQANLLFRLANEGARGRQGGGQSIQVTGPTMVFNGPTTGADVLAAGEQVNQMFVDKVVEALRQREDMALA